MDEKCTPMREPFWNEMDDAQKIAALQDAVIWISRDFMAPRRFVAQLAQHSHNAAGGIVVPLPPVVKGGLGAARCASSPPAPPCPIRSRLWNRGAPFTSAWSSRSPT